MLKTVKIIPKAYHQLKEYAIVNGLKLQFVFSEAIVEYLKKRRAYKG